MTKAPQLHLDSTMEDSLLSMQEEVSQELNTKAFQNLSNQKFQHQQTTRSTSVKYSAITSTGDVLPSTCLTYLTDSFGSRLTSIQSKT